MTPYSLGNLGQRLGSGGLSCELGKSKADMVFYVSVVEMPVYKLTPGSSMSSYNAGL